MAVISLKDKLETRFMIRGMTDLMELMIDSIIKDGNIVDIAHVNFDPECMDRLIIIMSRVPDGSIVDTFSKDRNYVLEENFRRNKLAKTSKIVSLKEAMDKPRDKASIVNFINSLNTEDVYDMISEQTLGLDLPLIAYMQLVRPSVKVTLGVYQERFYKYVCELLYAKNRSKIIETTDEYILFVKLRGDLKFYSKQVTITEKKTDKPFYVYPIGEITWDEFIDTIGDFYLIPAYFGRDKIMSDKNIAPLFKPLKQRFIEDMERYIDVNSKSLHKILLGG